MTDRYIEFYDTLSRRWMHLSLRYYKGCSYTDRRDPGSLHLTVLWFYPRAEYVIPANFVVVRDAINSGATRIHFDRDGHLEKP